MRLFAGFFLPEYVNDHLQMALESVNAAALGDSGARSRPVLRWVPQEDRHLTLGFFGEVPSGAVEELSAALAGAASETEALPLRLRGAGVFTGRTLWAGVQEQQTAEHSNGSTPLADLMRSVQHAWNGHSPRYLGNSGLGGLQERRRAHVTLARTRDRRKGEAEARLRAEALAVYEGPVWSPDTVRLVRSDLGAGKSGAPQYSTIAEFHTGSV